MLPDFATMADLRLGNLSNAVLAAGVAHHHAVDAAFHAAPIFTTMMGRAMSLFEDAGFERGPARAGSHVGIELFLDGLLASDERAVATYRSALSSMPHVRILHDVQDAARIDQLAERLRSAPLPEGYASSEFVADRLIQILQGRPRLRFKPEERGALADCLRTIQIDVNRMGAELVEDTAERLVDHGSP